MEGDLVGTAGALALCDVFAAATSVVVADRGLNVTARTGRVRWRVREVTWQHLRRFHVWQLAPWLKAWFELVGMDGPRLCAWVTLYPVGYGTELLQDGECALVRAAPFLIMFWASDWCSTGHSTEQSAIVLSRCENQQSFS